MEINEELLKYLTFIPLLIAMILHEISHGYCALFLGDNTAKERKRLSLNPIRHIDLYMTIILPLCLVMSGAKFLIGGAKPVPINPYNFKKPIRDMAIVAFAGPLMNMFLAIVSYVFYWGLVTGLTNVRPDAINQNILMTVIYLGILLRHSVIINVILAVFNLTPILPLDGGRILLACLPRKLAYYYSKLERFGLIIVIILVCTGFFHSFLDPLIMYLDKITRIGA